MINSSQGIYLKATDVGPHPRIYSNKVWLKFFPGGYGYIRNHQPQRPYPFALSLSLRDLLPVQPPLPQAGRLGLTLTTLDTRTGWGAPWKHLSFRKVEMMWTASLICLRKCVSGRRWVSMNLSRSLAETSSSSHMILGEGQESLWPKRWLQGAVASAGGSCRLSQSVSFPWKGGA